MPKKILLVEDESALQRTMGERLRSRGFEVIPALDGEEALRLSIETKPDVILLDLILPKRSGFDVLEAIKSDAATREIPVIVLTNLEGASDIERVLALGAASFLVKANYEIDEIISKVQQVLGT